MSRKLLCAAVIAALLPIGASAQDSVSKRAVEKSNRRRW